MKAYTLRALLALAVLASLLLGNRPIVRSSDAQPSRATITAIPPTPAAESPVVDAPETPVVPAYLALEPCSLAVHLAMCEDYASELAAYGLDIEDLSAWTAFGLRRFVEAAERLADAFGGGAQRSQRFARFSRALGTDTANGRILVSWQAVPQALDGNPVRGGYATNRLYFNPNTYFLDADTPEKARERSPQAIWWFYIHELAHLWDERSAPIAQARHSAAMRRWVNAQQENGRADVYPSRYAALGGPVEAFAESVAATVTGDAALTSYYGSVRDDFVLSALCEAAG